MNVFGLMNLNEEAQHLYPRKTTISINYNGAFSVNVYEV